MISDQLHRDAKSCVSNVKKQDFTSLLVKINMLASSAAKAGPEAFPVR